MLRRARRARRRCIVLEHVVVIDCLVDEMARFDPCIDRPCRSVCPLKHRLAVYPGDDEPVSLNRWIRPDHLQIKDQPSGLDRFDRTTQDVHDVLRRHTSERPGEDNEIERTRLDLVLLRPTRPGTRPCRRVRRAALRAPRSTASRSGSNATALSAAAAIPTVSRPSPRPISRTRMPRKSSARRSAARCAPSGSSAGDAIGLSPLHALWGGHDRDPFGLWASARMAFAKGVCPLTLPLRIADIGLTCDTNRVPRGELHQGHCSSAT